VVEVGTFLGRSSSFLAQGLIASPHAGRLYCYDDFIWRSNWNNRATLELADRESFQPYFEANMAPYAEVLTVRRGSAPSFRWDDGPVEILHVDSTKTWKSVFGLLDIFRDSFVPGRTLIAFQDYLHFPSYEIALALSCLDGLTPVHAVAGGATVTFRVDAPLLSREFPSGHTYLHWPRDKLMRRWEAITAALPAEAARGFAPALPLLLLTLGDEAEGRAAVRALAPSQAEAKQIQSTLRLKKDTPVGRAYLEELRPFLPPRKA
jgi:hypothetical protein